MTSNEEAAATAITDEAIQQLPLVVQVQPPAVADARDALLRAIGQEAQHVADKYAGQASQALGELARAYALVLFDPGTAATDQPGVAVRRKVAFDTRFIETLENAGLPVDQAR
ncbi:hypothetical protein [Streptomyces sp. NPDC048248]|uniref:hypothetical protein n=1 Tax=Streptomyces sp. NPDC048248 TaxID=3365523 RepID=UPI003722F2AF